MSEKISITEHCRSCGALLFGEFCSECGEKKFDKSELKFKHILIELLDDFTHFDSKIFKSIKLLVTKPGFLAGEFCWGIKVKYAKPLQLFFLVNILYFFVLSFGGFDTFVTTLSVQLNTAMHSDIANKLVAQKIEKRKITIEEYEEKFDHRINVLSKSMIIIFVPVFALFFMLLFINKRRLYTEHFIFSLNFLTWLLLLMIVLYLIFYFLLNGVQKLFAVDIKYLFQDTFISLVMFTAIGIYSYFGIRRFYKDKVWAAIAKAIVMPYLFLLVLNIYRFILFLATFYST